MHRLGQQVRGRVAQHVERVRVLRVARREELDPLAVGERQPQVARRTVDAREHGLLGELRPDRAGGVETGRAVGQLELGGVGKDDLHGGAEDRQGSGILESAMRARHLGRRRSRAAPAPRRPARAAGDRRETGRTTRRTSGSSSARRSPRPRSGSASRRAARRRRDARLLLISLAFIASAAFLGLHALATPGVLLGSNAGFELATPVGLVLAALFAAASSLELSSDAGRRRAARRHRLLIALLAALVVGWAVVSLAELPPLDDPLARRAARRLAARPRRARLRALRDRRVRLPPAPPATPGALRPRVRARVRAPRRGDGRHRLGAELAGLVVGVAHPHAHVVPAHRVPGASGVARGALQRALPRRDARGAPRRQRRPRRPRGLHGVHGATRRRRGRGDAERVLRARSSRSWSAPAARCTRSSATS